MTITKTLAKQWLEHKGYLVDDVKRVFGFGVNIEITFSYLDDDVGRMSYLKEDIIYFSKHIMRGKKLKRILNGN